MTQIASTPKAHLFRKRGRALLFDPCSRTSFALDVAGEAAAREMLGEKPVARTGAQADDDLLSLQTVSRRELAAARHELTALSRRGHFRDPGVARPDFDRKLCHAFWPTLSRRCNLRCRYCFTGHDHQRTAMSRPVAEATAKFIADHLAGDQPYHEVYLSLAGEPTVDLPLYQEFAGLLAEEGRRQGAVLQTSVTMTNLATLDNGALSGSAHELLRAWVSLDGPPQVHDAMRVWPDGTGTYADARRGLEILRGAGGEPGAVATVTALYPDVSEVYFHLFELEFPAVVVKPVRAESRLPYAIGQDLPGICEGYERLVDRLLDLSDDELMRCLVVILGPKGDDYFARFMVRVLMRQGLHWRGPVSSCRRPVAGSDSRRRNSVPVE